MVETIPKATHSGELVIGDLVLPCAVLEGEIRVLSERGVAKALGRARSGSHWQKQKQTLAGAHVPPFLSAKNLEPYIDAELSLALSQPIVYRGRDGGRAHGVEATLIPKICETWLRARDANALLPHQAHIGAKADLLMRGLARVGIIALVDEATGYQEERDRNELHKILAKYISKELLKWSRRFPDEFYQEMFRLKGWQFRPPSPKRPGYVGTLTNQLVYEKLPPGVLDELRSLNPAVKPGQRRYRHHQFLTVDVGNPHLEKHLLQVITLMRASRNWGEFHRLFERVYPGPQSKLDIPEEEA